MAFSIFASEIFGVGGTVGPQRELGFTPIWCKDSDLQVTKTRHQTALNRTRMVGNATKPPEYIPGNRGSKQVGKDFVLSG